MSEGVIVVGSVNCDSIYRVGSLPKAHETVLADSFLLAPGGKGSNQAVACSVTSDVPTRLVACVGQDAPAQTCLDYLQQNRVDTSQVKTLTQVPTGSACVMVDNNGDNQIVVSKGANAALTTDHIDDLTGLIERSRILLTQLETPIDVVEHALTRAREHGVTTVLNPAPYLEAAEQVLPVCDIITPNQPETASLTGIYPENEESAEGAAKALQGMGAKDVVITLGASGSFIASGDTLHHVSAYPCHQVVDTTGAGDVFNGAIAGALATGSSLVEAAIFASAAASMSVMKPSASNCAPRHKDVLAFMAEHPDLNSRNHR